MNKKVKIENLKKPRLSSIWEFFESHNNNIIFNNFMGGQFLLKNPPDYLIDILHLSNGKKDYDEIKSTVKSNHKNTSDFDHIFNQLRNRGIIRESIYILNEETNLSVDEINRFYPFILSLNDENNYDSLSFFKTIRNLNIAIIGLGGIGSIVAANLTACGIGSLTLVDGDIVEHSNLVRQILYTEEQADEKTHKTNALKSYLTSLSKYTKIREEPNYINSQTDLTKIVESHDFIFLTADTPRFEIAKWLYAESFKQKKPCLGSFQGSIGPIYCPKKSKGNPFLRFENLLKNKLSEHFEIIKNGLLEERTHQYPSNIVGVMEGAAQKTEEIISYFNKNKTPISIDKVISIKDK